VAGRWKDHSWYCLQRPKSQVADGPYTVHEVCEEARMLLQIQERPSIFRAVDVLRAIGFKVYREYQFGDDLGAVRLPEHLKSKRVQKETT